MFQPETMALELAVYDTIGCESGSFLSVGTPSTGQNPVNCVPVPYGTVTVPYEPVSLEFVGPTDGGPGFIASFVAHLPSGMTMFCIRPRCSLVTMISITLCTVMSRTFFQQECFQWISGRLGVHHLYRV